MDSISFPIHIPWLSHWSSPIDPHNLRTLAHRSVSAGCGRLLSHRLSAAWAALERFCEVATAASSVVTAWQTQLIELSGVSKWRDSQRKSIWFFWGMWWHIQWSAKKTWCSKFRDNHWIRLHDFFQILPRFSVSVTGASAEDFLWCKTLTASKLLNGIAVIQGDHRLQIRSYLRSGRRLVEKIQKSHVRGNLAGFFSVPQ